MLIFILITILLLFLFYASYSIQGGVYIKSFCKNKKATKQLLLTFDDGPHPIYTPKVLEILNKYNIKAVFFVIGQMAEKYPELILEIKNNGHIIGNHTYKHSWKFTISNLIKVNKEIEKCNKVLLKITNEQPIYFRPPFGVTNNIIAKGIKNNNMESIGWSIRSLDTYNQESKIICKRVAKKLHNGAVILLHDNREKIPILLEMIIKDCTNKGFSFVSLQQLKSC